MDSTGSKIAANTRSRSKNLKRSFHISLTPFRKGVANRLYVTAPA